MDSKGSEFFHVSVICNTAILEIYFYYIGIIQKNIVVEILNIIILLQFSFSIHNMRFSFQNMMVVLFKNFFLCLGTR